MRWVSSRNVFRIWASLAAPLLIAAVWVSFQTNIWLGITFLGCLSLWFYDMGATTCSRCSSYGTLQCGIQGRLIPLLFRKRSMRSASRWRVRMHRLYDKLMMIFAIIIFAPVPWLMAMMIVWSIVGLCVVYGPGRHHGLLHILRTQHENSGQELSNLVTLEPLSQSSNHRSASVPTDSKNQRIPDSPHQEDRSNGTKNIKRLSSSRPKPVPRR